MFAIPVPLRHGLAILLGVVATTMAHAQQVVSASLRQENAPKAADSSGGSVHRITILEGPNRRVQYITTGNLSSSDSQALYNLERAENELAYLRDLQQLKRQYVTSELSLEPHRRAIQFDLYGRQVNYRSSSSSYVNYSPYSSYGYPGGIYGYYGANSPYMYGPHFGGYGRSYGGALGYGSSNSYSESRGLQYGMGDEGRMKNAIVHVIASQYAPDYATAAAHNYQTALDTAADSTVLSRDLGLQKSKKSAPPPSKEKGSPKSDK